MLYGNVPNSYAIPALAYGHQHEQDAREAYIRWKGENGTVVTVKESGLCVMANGYLGCSPDGIIFDHDVQEQGILEIKCPSTAAQVPLRDLSKRNSQFCSKLTVDGALTLKRSYAYFYQVQGNMGVTGLKWCDFVLWAPSEIFVERILFDQVLWDICRRNFAISFHTGFCQRCY